MNFDPSPEQKAFSDKVKRVIKESIKPEYPKWKPEKTTPRRFWELLGAEGLLGFREDGGKVNPIPWLENIHFYREMAAFDGGLAIASFASTQLGLQGIQFFGNKEQKASCLLSGVRGEKIFAFANTEASAGSDASAIKLRAEDKGDHYLLNGGKAYITNADIADHIVVTAVTHPEEEKQHRRISMFLIDGNTPGLVRTRLKKYGWKLSHLCTMAFKDVKIPKESLLGEEKRGFYQTMQIFNNSRIGIAALAFGTALGAYTEAYKHATRRQVFGKPLFEHQAKANEFAENIAILQAAWLLVQKAAFLKDNAREFWGHASMAKLFCTEEGAKIAHWAVTTFGARGVMEAMKVAEYPHDAQVALVGEGAPEVQKKIVAERVEELLKGL